MPAITHTQVVGTTANTIAAGDDSRIIGAVAAASVGAVSGVASLGPDGKLTASQVPTGLASGTTPKGLWNAAANTTDPAGSLATGVGTLGDLWAVAVAGTTTLDGTSEWAIGDQAWFTDGRWQRLPFSTVMAALALTSLTSIGLADNAKITPRLSLVPGLVQTWTAGGDIAGAIRNNGELWFARALFPVVTGGSATFSTVTTPSLSATDATLTTATVTAGTLAGVEHRPRSLIPGWSFMGQDSAGNAAYGLKDDGTFVISKASVASLTVDDLILSSTGVPSATSIVPNAPLMPETALYDVDQAGNVARVLQNTGRVVELPRPAIITRAGWHAVKPTMVHSYTTPRTSSDAPVASGTTIATLWSMDLPFDWIRIIGGQQLGGAGVMSAICAPTAHPSDGVNPVDSAGDPVPWKTIKFNNPGSMTHTPWNQATGSGTSVTMTTGSTVEIWGMNASDWIPVSSLARSDGGKFPLLMVRVLLTGAAPVAVTMTPSDYWMGLEPALYAFGRSWASYAALGDYVSTTGGFPSSGTDFGEPWAPLIVQTYSRGLGFQLWGVGDSNMAGSGSAGGLMGFYRKTGLALGRRFPTITANFNQPGSDPTTYMANPSAVLDAVKPSGLVMFPTSSNGGALTEARLDDNWSNAMVLAERTMRHGGVPVLMGYPPRPGLPAAHDAVRLQSLARIDDAAAGGMLCVNTNDQIAVPGTPQEWRSGMSKDNTHYSQEGHNLVGAALTVKLTDAFGIY